MDSNKKIIKLYKNINYNDIYFKHYFSTRPNEHSMGNSLEKYIEMKIPKIILDKAVENIVINGAYIRENCNLTKEKNDKLFNYKRPTFEVSGNTVYIYCYPRNRLCLSLFKFDKNLFKYKKYTKRSFR